MYVIMPIMCCTVMVISQVFMVSQLFAKLQKLKPLKISCYSVHTVHNQSLTVHIYCGSCMLSTIYAHPILHPLASKFKFYSIDMNSNS